MITENNAKNEYIGLSTDTKPVEGIENASHFLEMDTDKRFMFDEQHGEWLEQKGEESGGGGSASGLVVNVSYIEEVRTMDKTWKEIHDALENGVPVIVKLPDVEDPDYPETDVISMVNGVMHDAYGYEVYYYYSIGMMTAVADSEDGYPKELSDG